MTEQRQGLFVPSRLVQPSAERAGRSGVLGLGLQCQGVVCLGFRTPPGIVEQLADQIDALVSATMMFVLSASVLLTAASTLHGQGLKMNNISEMIPMLRPLFGDWALGIFVVGILSAGISSHLPNMMVIPWLTGDMYGRPRTTRTLQTAYVFGLLTLVSILGAVLDARPVFLLLLSQAGISVVMPLALLGLMWLSTREELVGSHRPRPIEWILLTGIAAFSLFMSTLAVQGLVKDVRSLL